MRILTFQDFATNANHEQDMIQPFPTPDLMTPTSVDLTLGDRALNITTGDELTIEKGNPLRMRHGDFVNVWTDETLNIPERVFGFVFSKVSLVAQGLTQFGTKIDPGFKGKLRLSFRNDGNTVIELRKGQPICSVSLFELREPPGKTYELGTGITVAKLAPPISFTYELTEEDIKKLERYYSRDILNLHEALVKKSDEQYKRIEEARQDIRSMSREIRIALWPVVIALIAAIASVIALVIYLFIGGAGP